MLYHGFYLIFKLILSSQTLITSCITKDDIALNIQADKVWQAKLFLESIY